MYSKEMQAKISELLRRDEFDIIQVEMNQLRSFRFDKNTVLVVDEHDIGFELLYRMYQNERSRLRRLYNWAEYKKFKREELKDWRDASGIVTTSAREQQIITRLSAGTPVAVVPNAVDVSYFEPSSEPINPDAIVITGLMKYRPNVDAVLYFVQEIFPHILASRPRMVFYIVGASPAEEVRRLASPNVVVTDTVADVRPYAHQAAVFVVPLRMGGGTRLKVLEALSMKKAVVSTSLGCEGIDAKHGQHLLIADEPRAFANSVLELLANRVLANKLAAQGRELVEHRYRWETVVEGLESFYVELLQATPVGASSGDQRGA
jgi:glycosyltransferase involved in cell wall biosynthesis